MEEYCICSHLKSRHNGWEGEPTGCCSLSGQDRRLICECSEFKLDNLRFVEDEAKRRNLIN
jgi:hypothetical protein